MHYDWSAIVRQSGLFLVAIALLSIFSGLFLESNLRLLSAFPSILLVVPAFIDACGDITTTFAARLTSALGLGLVSFRKKKKRIYRNVQATFALTVLFFALTAAMAYVLSIALGFSTPPFLLFFSAVLVSAIAVVLMSVAIAIVVAYVVISRGLDPDNFEAPLLSTFSDLAGVFILINICRIVFLGG